MIRIRLFTSLFTASLGLLTPGQGMSQATDPEWVALLSYTECVTAAAKKYSILDQPITDVVEVAIASCEENFSGFQDVLKAEVNIDKRPAFVIYAKDKARSDALVAVADAKLTAKQ